MYSMPTKVTLPWGTNAGGDFIRQVPNTTVTPGAASFATGFPPLTFTPVDAGGIPPFGKDMNGVLNQLTAWARWQAAGGPAKYDPAFQTAINGYPLHAMVESLTTPFLRWISTADDNMTNPDAGGAGWRTPVFPDVGTDGLTISADPAQPRGANLAFVGDGAVTPKKWLRAAHGQLSVMNDVYTTEILTLTDDGTLSVTNHLRANQGASGQVDPKIAVLLGDYATNITPGVAFPADTARDWDHTHPDGFLEQGGFISTATNTLNQTFQFRKAFAQRLFTLQATIGSQITAAGTAGAIGVAPYKSPGSPNAPGLTNLTHFLLSNTNPAGPAQGVFWYAAGI